MTKASVIIASYNYGKYLNEAISSIKNQTLQDFELIVIDDCSADEYTQKVLLDIEKDKSVTLIRNEKNMGVVYSRNYATKLAKSENIIYLDSDDKLRSDCLEKMYDKMDQYDVVSSGVQEFGQSNNVSKNKKFDKFTLCYKSIIQISSMFKKDLWEKCGGFNANMKNGCEDYDFWLSMCEAGARFYILKEPLFLYMTKAQSRNVSAATYHSAELSLNIIKNHPKLFSWFIPQVKQKMRMMRIQKRTLYTSISVNIISFATIFYLINFS